ncbi:MAG: acyl-ACP--UDP-N-acetylglucosamine O-acyltransferase [Bacteroidales bacterium]|jgi:UDP-N-acetylglucosamine acyltransferase|nr:acyl-ACP--UDP-N-acetylglucosamine O-acyltransferase [Bacteroidales bacterium]
MNQPVAYIHPDAKIGANVTISPFAYISGDVVIGDGTWIGPSVTIFDGARIGKKCQIFPGAVISAVPQDLKFSGEYTTTEIGDRTVIRECVTIHRGTTDKMKTVVGSDCLLMGYVHVAHDCIVGNHCIFANYAALSGHCVVGDYAIIEGQAGAGQFVHIGAHTFIAGTTAIRKNVPPFVKAAREPISYMGINAIGLRRRGFSEEKINTIQDIYRVLFQKGVNISQALEIIKRDFPESPEREQIIDFVLMSDKGIINRG